MFLRKAYNMQTRQFFVSAARQRLRARFPVGLHVLAGLAALAAGPTVLASSAHAVSIPTTGLTFWVDASDPLGNGSTPVPGALSTWVNKAPTAQQDGLAAVVQASPTNQPTLTTAATGLNGLPVVRFDGVNDFMQNPFTTALGQATEIFMVWKADSIGGNASIAFDGFSPAGRQTMAYENQGGVNMIDMGAGTPAGANSGIASSFSTAIYTTAIYNGNGSLWIDGAPQTFTNPYVGTNPLDGVTLGGRYDTYPGGGSGDRFSLDGYIAEMLVYNSPLDTTDRNAVESYLDNKWFVVSTPEPASAVLASIGIVGLALLGWRRLRTDA